MTEQGEVNRLLDAFPALRAISIRDYGVDSAMIEKKALEEYLKKHALYFFRGGVESLARQLREMS